MRVLFQQFQGLFFALATNGSDLCLVLQVQVGAGTLLYRLLNVLVRYVHALAYDDSLLFLDLVLLAGLPVVVLDGCSKGLVSQNRAVDLVLRQSAELPGNIRRGNVVRFLQLHRA